MFAKVSTDSHLEIGHVLFIDIVGYSKRTVDEQKELVTRLNQLVRNTAPFRSADAADRLIRIPTGDGMALAFFTSPDAPVNCAIELAKANQADPKLELRMGIHSGPVDRLADVNERTNLAGAGMNMAQRVMDCGDAGHILLSKRAADDLAQYAEWRPRLHDLGEVEVKHGQRIGVMNFYLEGIGNPALPEKLKRAARAKRRRTVLWLALASMLLVATSAWWLLFERARSKAALAVPEKSIAVLPFENLSEEKENAYFTDGVQNEILTDLAKVQDLKVISRTSVLNYKAGAARNLREIAQQLGVAHVLEGSVQRAAGKVRVNAQLIDARTDKHLWAQSYDRALSDVFAIETEIAQIIANELQAKLSARERTLIEQIPTQNLAAYDLYVRAVPLIDSAAVSPTQDKDLIQAVDLLNQAVALDPNFLLAYCWLARAHDSIYFMLSPDRNRDHTPARLALAKSAIDSAFRLQPDSGEAHLAMGRHLYWGYFDYDHARAEVGLAARTLPNNPIVFQLTGLMDRRQSRWAEAVRNLERASELDPRNENYLINLITTYKMVQDYDGSRRALDRWHLLKPNDYRARLGRAEIERDQRADLQPWRHELLKVMAENPGSAAMLKADRFYLATLERDFDTAASVAAELPEKDAFEDGTQLGHTFYMGVVARLKGNAEEAKNGLTKARLQQEQIVRAQPEDGQVLCGLAMIDAGLGRKEEALREAWRAIELAPISKNSLHGAIVLTDFAVICGWTGEYDLAFKQLEELTQIPGGPSYGELRLSPMWDPLRGDPRFDKIVALLAPKDADSK